MMQIMREALERKDIRVDLSVINMTVLEARNIPNILGIIWNNGMRVTVFWNIDAFGDDSSGLSLCPRSLLHYNIAHFYVGKWLRNPLFWAANLFSKVQCSFKQSYVC